MLNFLGVTVLCRTISSEKPLPMLWESLVIENILNEKTQHVVTRRPWVSSFASSSSPLLLTPPAAGDRQNRVQIPH